MSKYDEYLAIRRTREAAEGWNNLPQGPRYRSDRMAISPAHCQLKLVRAGQQSEGGKNYWDAPGELSAEILAILATDNSIIQKAIAAMRGKERLALIACEDEARARLAAIEEAKSKE